MLKCHCDSLVLINVLPSDAHIIVLLPSDNISHTVPTQAAFGAFGAVSVTLTRHHKQLSC